MPFHAIARAHYQVVCDRCRADAEVCGKRSIGMSGAPAAVRQLVAAGWHHDANPSWSTRDTGWVAENGAGKWYCPACARQHI